MIIASDLDRTLIYSDRAIAELGEPTIAELKPVELREGKWLAFMTEAAYVILQELARKCLFIPVTTRTTEQFKRIVIFEEEIPITYAITSNGANIIYKGELLSDWSEQITSVMSSESIGMEELNSKIKKQGFGLDGQKKQAEKLFFYYIFDRVPSALELLAIREFVSQYGWRTSLQGRKLYFIPNVISKGKALEFIAKLEGMEMIAGAGDSVLDWDFLRNCRYPFVPRHGELKNEIITTDVTFTSKRGIEAGEEILHYFLNTLALKS